MGKLFNENELINKLSMTRPEEIEEEPLNEPI
jgi:hypothetical protein